MAIEELDDEEQIISSSAWRYACLGVNKKDPKKSGGGNSTWTACRDIIGMFEIVNGKKVYTEIKSLTRREAFLVLVRSKIRNICKELGIKCPRIGIHNPKPGDLDYPQLEAIANLWIKKIGTPMDDALAILANVDGPVVGTKLEEVMKSWSGKKSWSESTTRRIFKEAGLKYKRRKKYPPAQISQLFKRSQKRIG